MSLTPKFISCAALALAMSALASHTTLAGPSKQALWETGHTLAVNECSSCHAIGRSGASPRHGAPVFRHILSRYHSDVLEEELVEGIQVGHPDMPKLRLNPAAVSALVVYLRSIQTKHSTANTSQH